MANENIVTIPLEEYIVLRRKADENLYLANKLGEFESRLCQLENALHRLEGMVQNG